MHGRSHHETLWDAPRLPATPRRHLGGPYVQPQHGTRRPSPASQQIAQSFYDQLSREGFTPHQVVGLATHLLDLVRRKPAVHA